VPAAALVLILPLLALRPERQALAPELAVPWDRRDIVIASISRLLVQLSCATLTLYLLYYFKTLVPAGSDAAGLVGTVLTISYIIPLPVALALGRWSDLSGRRKPFLCGSALVGTAGLLGMAGADNAWQGAAAFCVYATGTAVFLSLHVTFAMQLLPRPDRRGRDLGLVNLTNTAPAIVGTLIVWQLAAPQDFTPVLLAFAAIKGIGAIVILAVRERPRMPAR
jgi:MFS family permease